MNKPATPFNILIIDDDEVDRMTVRRALSSAGIDVVIEEASDGGSGLKAMQAKVYDCIFLDYYLPDGDGLDVLKAAHDAGVRSPIVMLTGRGDERLAITMMHAGASDYIPKNQWSSETIAHSVHTVTRLHQLELAHAKARVAMQQALAHNAFELHYQPLVELGAGRIVGAEALIRWNHPERGLLMPAQFLTLAEETGMIVPIGEWVLNTACAQAVVWQKAGHDNMRIAVNLSDRQFRNENIVTSVMHALQQSGLKGEFLELELTENILMSAPNAFDILEALRATGVTLSIDDFGTGYSSLGRLKDLPIHTLKIDQSFVREIADNKNSAAIIETIMALARNLELKVLAEGVETATQFACLKAMACDEIQGFFFSRPRPIEAFNEMLEQKQGGT